MATFVPKNCVPYKFLILYNTQLNYKLHWATSGGVWFRAVTVKRRVTEEIPTNYLFTFYYSHTWGLINRLSNVKVDCRVCKWNETQLNEKQIIEILQCQHGVWAICFGLPAHRANNIFSTNIVLSHSKLVKINRFQPFV